MDLSWRGGSHGGFGSYERAKKWISFLSAHADELEIEMIIDYFPGPYGAGYKCDRDSVVSYTSPTVQGAPGGDWIHVELSPRVADDPGFFERVLPTLGDGATAAKPRVSNEPVLDEPGPEQFPGHVIAVGHGHKHEVRAIQERIGVKVDGDFGPLTKKGVEAFQKRRDLPVTGTVNKATWTALFGVAPSSDTLVVRAGEGWWQIASRGLGSGSRWREVAGLNGGVGRVLMAGDLVMLPSASEPSGGIVRVERGDSWWALAERTLGSGARWVELAAINGGESRQLHPGDVLVLP
jgi:hypothetical protein